MKILYVTSSAPFGKGESFVISEIEAVAELVELVVVAPVWRRRPKNVRHLSGKDTRILDTGAFSPATLWALVLQILQSPIISTKLFLSILSANPKHLIANLHAFPKGIYFGRLARQLGVEHIHAHWMTSSATAALIASRTSGTPWSVSAHRGDIVDNNKFAPKLGSVSFVRAISHQADKLFRDVGYDASKLIRCIHMGVSVPEKRTRLRSTSQPFTILVPANLLPVKGHKYLFEAFAEMKHDSAKLLVAGDGVLRHELREQVQSLGISTRVEFLGHVDHGTILQWYAERKVDLVVLPSIDLGNGVHEGIPVSLMEAMANSVPVVSTRTGAIEELVLPSCGRLVEQKDSSELATAMLSFINSAELREQAARNAYAHVAENFNMKIIAKQLVAAFSEKT